MNDRFTIRFKNKEILEELKYLSFVLNKSTNRVIQDMITQGLKNRNYAEKKETKKDKK